MHSWQSGGRQYEDPVAAVFHPLTYALLFQSSRHNTSPLRKTHMEFPVAQWLGRHARNAGPGLGNCTPCVTAGSWHATTKDPRATSETWCSQIYILKKNNAF